MEVVRGGVGGGYSWAEEEVGIAMTSDERGNKGGSQVCGWDGREL